MVFQLQELEILRNELHFEELQAEARRLDEMRCRGRVVGVTGTAPLKGTGAMGKKWEKPGDVHRFSGVFWKMLGFY